MNENWDKENIQNVDVENTEYAAAIQLTQKCMDLFISAFRDRENNKLKFSIKKKFEENGQIEHMWATPISYNDEMFNAILDNVPNKLTMIKYNDVVSINRIDIEDLLVVENGEVLIGNFIWHSLND